MSVYPRSKNRECGNCYGNGCFVCSNSGRDELTDDERTDFDDAMERRAEAARDDWMMGSD